jgi:hypothetical protein
MTARSKPSCPHLITPLLIPTLFVGAVVGGSVGDLWVACCWVGIGGFLVASWWLLGGFGIGGVWVAAWHRWVACGRLQAHPQLTIREAAARAFSAYLSRSQFQEVLEFFHDIVHRLRSGEPTSSEANGKGGGGGGLGTTYVAAYLPSLLPPLAARRSRSRFIQPGPRRSPLVQPQPHNLPLPRSQSGKNSRAKRRRCLAGWGSVCWVCSLVPGTDFRC